MSLPRGEPCCATECTEFQRKCDCSKCPRLPGLFAAYYKIEDSDVESLNDIDFLKTPDYTGTCLDVDFDAKAFQGITAGFPEDHFAARWRGEIEVLVGGTYVFYATSDDGSAVFIDGQLVVDNDGLHGAEEWKTGTMELVPGYYPLIVTYFEKDGGQIVKVKYSGPDTFGQKVYLRGFHSGVRPAEDPVPADIMFPGFAAAYYKIAEYVDVVPDLQGLTPDFTATTINVDYDAESFRAIDKAFPNNTFAARWSGQMKVTVGGAYTFFVTTNAQDLSVSQVLGVRVIVENAIVVEYNGGEGEDEWKEGTLELKSGFFTIVVDYFHRIGNQGIRVQYSGPDTSGKRTSLQVQHTKAEEVNLCADDYKVMTGDVGGWGKIGSRGGGESVEDCDRCAYMCSGIAACRSYECSETELRCNLNTDSKPTHMDYKDYMFCSKDVKRTSQQVMVAGWQGAYYKTPGNISNIPDLLGRKIDFNGTTLEIDMDKNSFQAVSEGFPSNFAARWMGKMNIRVASNYTFYVKSGDGTRVILDNIILIDNDGLHGAEDWKTGERALRIGWHTVIVDYFGQLGEQGVKLKYSGADTFGDVAFLRAYHVITNICTGDYLLMPGDVGAWGTIGKHGGGEAVDDCGDCANLCSDAASCGSFECSPTELKCNLNEANDPTNKEGFQDFIFCKKDLTKSVHTMLPGWQGEYYKMPANIRYLPDFRGRVPDFNSTTLDISFDKGEFQGIAADFPADHFSARWTGSVQIMEAGKYTFYMTSGDGSKLFVGSEIAVSDDGLHEMDAWMEGTVELPTGFVPVTVDYFEGDGDQGIQVRYTGPDTYGETVSLRVFHPAFPEIFDAPSVVKLPGLKGSFFKLGDNANMIPDLRGLEPDFNFTSLDVDFDQNAFGVIKNKISAGNFAIRWEGEIQILALGNYTFSASSDDGCRVVVDNVLLVDYDGVHGMEKWKKSTARLLVPGWYPITVDYFEKDGDGGIQVKYAGPDTFGKVIALTSLCTYMAVNTCKTMKV